MGPATQASEYDHVPVAVDAETPVADRPTPRRDRSGAISARRLIRDASVVLIIAGTVLLADVAVTLLWREPVTAVIGVVKRDQIDQRLLRTLLTPIDRRALAGLQTDQQRIAFLARRMRSRVKTGAGIGWIHIPKIGANYEIIQGTDTASLEAGPGHYPATALPGVGQTVGIAGHRTTYLAPFRRINELVPGNRIIVRMPYATFTYRVQYHRIVTPTSFWIVDNVGYDRLVLSACNPLFSAAQRIVVFARLVKEQIAREALPARPRA
jgi:sortase A